VSDAPYRILMVCTGNICRSPFMERLFLARLRARLSAADAARFEIGSCGTWAMVGSPMSPEAAETLIEVSGDPGGFVARAMTAELLDADLILTATREHRGQVVTEVPGAAKRTLTAREFARLLAPVTRDDIDARAPGGDPVERMRAIVDAAMANRGLVPLAEAAEDDIADPYGRDRRAYARAAAEIDAALSVPLTLLLGA
jgi:protein-tyrosine phosphatase